MKISTAVGRKQSIYGQRHSRIQFVENSAIPADRDPTGPRIIAKKRSISRRRANPIKRIWIKCIRDNETRVAEDDKIDAKSISRVINHRSAEFHGERSARADRNQLAGAVGRVEGIHRSPKSPGCYP